MPSDMQLEILTLNIIFLTVESCSNMRYCKCFEELELADCSEGNLQVIPKNFPSYVQNVILVGNVLKSLDSRLFYKGLGIRKLDVSLNAIDSVAVDAFLNIRHTLVKLYLRGNRLTKIPDEALSQLPLLEELSVANNEILALGSKCFEKFVSLKHLDLSGNWLDQIPSNAFYGLNKLLHLDLSTNKLGALTASTLRNLNSLVYLDLSRNALSKIHPSSFTHSSFIEVLHLEHNQIQAMEVGKSSELGRLRLLDLSGNNFTIISENSFQGMKRLEKLIIKENKIEAIQEESFRGMVNLRVFDISYNNLQEFPGYETWQGLTKLEDILMSANNITHLPDHVFGPIDSVGRNDLRAVSYVDLGENQLTMVHSRAFESFLGMQKLNLSKNRLSDVSGTAFIGNMNLEEIYLNHNLLQTPNFSWFSGNMRPVINRYYNLSKFLNGNPWRCDCSLYKGAKEYLTDVHITRMNQSPLDGVICFQPLYLRGRTFSWFLEMESGNCTGSVYHVLLFFCLLIATSFILLIISRKVASNPNSVSYKIKGRRNRLDSYKRDKIL